MPTQSPGHPVVPDESRFEYEKRQSEQAWRRAEAEQARGHPAEARRWLERAVRFTPFDQNLAFALATARLLDNDAGAALALFARIAARHAVREVFCGLAASALRAGHRAQAATAIGRALSGFAADATVATIAASCATAWCGVSATGQLVLPPLSQPSLPQARLPQARLPKPKLALDGQPIQPGPHGQLPPAWATAHRLDVTFAGRRALGSPVDLAAFRRTEGFVRRTPAGVAGWAWHPANPQTDPVLTLEANASRRLITATNRAIAVSGNAPLAQPRGFAVRVAGAGAIRVLGADGRDLWGSPLAAARPPAAAPRPRRTAAVTVVIPVYRGLAATLACLRSVLATIGAQDRVVVVNDASPDPALAAALSAMAQSGAIDLIPCCPADPARNLGFPAAANAGLRAAAGTDAVLLNSDTLVFPGWLRRLRAAAHAAANTGTATPFSNDATIFTYPDPAAPAPMPTPEQGAALARLAARANAGTVIDVPTGHGFCLYIKAACLHATGLLREDVFAQGYGEENDFCERARALGWRHVAVPGVYVAHEGGVSFGAAREFLLRRNAAHLRALHPDYHRRVDAFIAANPLADARRRLDALRWRAAPRHAGKGAVLLVAHDGTGGTGRVLRERAQAVRKSGHTPVTLTADDGVTIVDAAEFPNLRFRLPAELPALIRLLAAARPVRAELHHLLGHDAAVTQLLSRFGVPYDVWVHDWQWLCPRLSFVTPEGVYCGEPPARDCDACTARGAPPAIPVPATVLRARSAALLAGARRVVAASTDAAARLRRHFPGLRPLIRPWEPDPGPPPDRAAPPSGWRTIAVVGALGVEKGYGVLLACARDAASRGLKLRFAVAGYTIDDTPLLETGRVFVTGPFAAGEARGLIAGLGADFAFLPSIWPETWCYALSDAWHAGLDAAVFDIGAPAERVRRSGRGWVLPLHLPPASVNDALLRLQGVAGRSEPLRRSRH